MYHRYPISVYIPVFVYLSGQHYVLDQHLNHRYAGVGGAMSGDIITRPTASSTATQDYLIDEFITNTGPFEVRYDST